MDKVRKCHRDPKDTPEQQNYIYCWALDQIADYSNGTPSQKGIFIRQYSNMDTFERSRQIVIAKCGKHVKRGMVLRYCPMCGETIYRNEEEEREQYDEFIAALDKAAKAP